MELLFSLLFLASSTRSHFLFPSFELVYIILENHFVIFNPIQRLHKKNAPYSVASFSLRCRRAAIHLSSHFVLDIWGWRKNIACDTSRKSYWFSRLVFRTQLRLVSKMTDALTSVTHRYWDYYHSSFSNIQYIPNHSKYWILFFIVSLNPPNYKTFSNF